MVAVIFAVGAVIYFKCGGSISVETNSNNEIVQPVLNNEQNVTSVLQVHNVEPSVPYMTDEEMKAHFMMANDLTSAEFDDCVSKASELMNKKSDLLTDKEYTLLFQLEYEGFVDYVLGNHRKV
jgi:hypothetical protein